MAMLRRRRCRAPAAALAILAALLLAPRVLAAQPDGTEGVQAGQAGWRVDIATGLPDAEAARAQALVDATLARLPPRWRASDRALALAFRDDLPDGVHGRIRGARITLARALLAPPPADDVDPGVAALLHELAHAWDRQHGLSRDPRLLDLAGWQVKPLGPGRTRGNAFSVRSPDAYELASPAEFVAVNLEHFLLDRDYACRRPALHAFFAAHFDWAPPAGACDPALPWVDAGVLADETARPLLELDPARVHAVDYLLAGDGDAMMSRWGHAMLRLVVCAPGRTPGPDCRLDLAHHRVLSFRAFVDDVQLSGWRGLTGGYPSRLFVLPLGQVVEEYTRVELRPLDAIPLRLAPDEIRTLLERAARVHWSYDGRYRFVGNNCAVETWKLLHDALPRAAAARLDSVTPKGLLRRLERAGLVDVAARPTDPATAVRDGFRFEPWSTHYQSLYDTARSGRVGLPRDVEGWLRLPPSGRRPVLAGADLRASAAFLLLEEAALQRERHRARDVLKRLLPAPGRGRRRDAAFAGEGAAVAGDAPAGGAHPGDADMSALLAEALHEGGLLASPGALLSLPGYGVPQAAERAQAAAGAGERAARLRVLGMRLEALAAAWLPPADREALAQAEANVALLGRRLRELHRAEGGFTLPPAPGPGAPAAVPRP